LQELLLAQTEEIAVAEVLQPVDGGLEQQTPDVFALQDTSNPLHCIATLESERSSLE
jgi:hypothetical protein